MNELEILAIMFGVTFRALLAGAVLLDDAEVISGAGVDSRSNLLVALQTFVRLQTAQLVASGAT